jgi:excisionase family DNA binding protein
MAQKRRRKKQVVLQADTEVLSVREAGALLHCCDATVRHYIQRGDLIASRPSGKRLLIQRVDLYAFLKASQVKSAS